MNMIQANSHQGQTEQDAFFRQRMELLDLTEENNHIQIFNPEAEPPMSKISTQKIFWYDQDGNITIRYYTIDGEQITFYTDAKNPQPRPYMTKRLREPKGDMKYQMPKGQGTYPWFHPETVRKFKEGERIETLYLTEGVFKAWMAGVHGMDVVGLSSITHYAGPDKKLHRDLVRLIEECQVDHVCILWDGDCLDVSAKGILVREEATKRPYGFFAAAKRIRKLVLNAEWEKNRQAPRVHFMHVRSDAIEGNPKGLDDLLLVAKAEGKMKEVLHDMANLGDTGRWFYKKEITSTTQTLYQYFRLDDVNKFYALHAKVIGEQEFLFRGDVYYYSDRDEVLKMLQPAWANTIFWIGDEFFEEVLIPSVYGARRTLEHRKRETLTARLGKDFQKHLKYHHGFICLPNHFAYERIVESDDKEFFNRYYPFAHIPKPGKWDNIDGFIKHIFGTQDVIHPKTKERIPNYELGLDYLQILLMEPAQKLPILVLFSPENQTGKSTFGELCYRIWGDNVVFIGNSDLQSDFNEMFAGRLLAICEETMLERKKDAERIKNMSTASRLLVNPKGQKQYTIDFFTKFQFYSNNPRMVYVNRHDDRYWILKVNAIPKDQLDPRLPARMWEEVPAFVQFLKNRKLATNRESRMHFNPDMLRTEVFMDTVRLNEPSAASELRQQIAEMFISLGPDVEEIEMPIGNIQEEFFTSRTSLSWIREILHDYLQADVLRTPTGASIRKRGSYQKVVFNEYGEDGEGKLEIKTVKFNSRPYVFRREEYVLEDIVEEGSSAPKEDDMPDVDDIFGPA